MFRKVGWVLVSLIARERWDCQKGIGAGSGWSLTIWEESTVREFRIEPYRSSRWGKGQGCGSAEMQGVRQAGLTGVSRDYEGFERVLGVSSWVTGSGPG